MYPRQPDSPESPKAPLWPMCHPELENCPPWWLQFEAAHLKEKQGAFYDLKRSAESCAEVAIVALTFFLDAFVSCNQSQSHHLWSRPVDLELLQFRVLLYVLFCRFRLRERAYFCYQLINPHATKHTEQSGSLHQRRTVTIGVHSNVSQKGIILG